MGPPATAKRSKQIEAAIASIEQRLHRSPTEEEIASNCDTNGRVSRVARRDPRREPGAVWSAPADEDGRDLLHYISDNEDNWPSRILERAELEQLVRGAIDKMPHIERTVLTLYFHEELTLREISESSNSMNAGLPTQVAGNFASAFVHRETVAIARG